jgi:thioesterase domain-containing protein
MDEPQAIDFRAALARDLTFKVIRVGGWREWRHHELGMADIVSGALAQIEVAVPKGPLLLIGFCQGGQLAYATALAAVEAGREVQRVILIDAVLAETAATLGERILYLVRELTGRPGDDRDRVERGAQIPFAAWEVIQRLVPQGVLLGAMARFSESLLKRPNGVRMARRVQMQLFYTLWKAWLQRRRETLRVPVTLLRADGPGADDLGWGPLCPELLVVRVGGDHRSIFAPENHESLRIALLDGLADRKRNQALEKVEA